MENKEKEDLNRKTELILISKMMELPNRNARRKFAKKIGISWEEYQYLLQKWKHVIKETLKRGKQLIEKETL